MRALALLLCLLPGCALSHEVSIDANRDVGGTVSITFPCPPGSASGPTRDCGWQASGAMSCRPGATLRIGCSGACGLGSCTGDSMIRVCDSVPCTAAVELAHNDDNACGADHDFVCSFIDGVNCPSSGTIYVLTAPFSVGSPYTCNVEIR